MVAPLSAKLLAFVPEIASVPLNELDTDAVDCHRCATMRRSRSWYRSRGERDDWKENTKQYDEVFHGA
jgi:hypothetical protein